MEKQIHHAALLSHGAWGSRKFRSVHFTVNKPGWSVNHPNAVHKDIHDHPAVKRALASGWKVEHMIGGENRDHIMASHQSALKSKKRLDHEMGVARRS